MGGFVGEVERLVEGGKGVQEEEEEEEEDEPIVLTSQAFSFL